MSVPLCSFAAVKVNKSVLCVLRNIERPEICQSVSLANIKIKTQYYSQWEQSINSSRQIQGKEVFFSIPVNFPYNYIVSQKDMYLPGGSLTDISCNVHSSRQSASVYEEVDWKTFTYSESGWNGALLDNEFKVSESKSTNPKKYVIQSSTYCKNEWGERNYRQGETWEIEVEEIPD